MSLVLKKSKQFFYWLFVTPLLVTLFVFFMIPLGIILWLSFYHMPTGLQPVFTGLNNYIEVLEMSEFWISIQNTLVYAFSAVFVKAMIGLAVAILLSQEFKGRGILRGLVLIPYSLPTFICAVIFWFVYYQKGVANLILTSLGLAPVNWLSIKLAMPSIIFVNIWHGWPFFYLGLLAGLQAIPVELYECASVDGATGFQRFRYITLPLIKPVLIIVSSLSLMWTMGDFVIPWMMTGGGPLNATLTIPIATYKIAFLTRVDVPLAAAYSVYILPLYIILMYYVIKQLGR